MGWVRKISSSIDVISKLTGILSAFLMGAIAFVVSYEVLMRYVFRAPTGWTIEFVPFLILWGGFIGASLTLKEDRHIRVDLLIRHLSPKARSIMHVITGGIGLLFCSVLFVEGLKMSMQTKELGTVTSGTLVIPIFIPQLCIPVGAALLFLQFLKRFGQDIDSLRRGGIKNEEEGQPL